MKAQRKYRWCGWLILLILCGGCSTPSYRVLNSQASQEEFLPEVPEYSGVVNPYTGKESETETYDPVAVMVESPVQADLMIEVMTGEDPAYMAVWSERSAMPENLTLTPEYSLSALLAKGLGAEYISTAGTRKSETLGKKTIWNFYPPDYRDAVGKECGKITAYPCLDSQEGAVLYEYDAERHAYMREGIYWENLILLETESSYDMDGVWSMDLCGGTGYYFRQGKYQEIRWQEPTAKEPLVLWNEDKEELRLYAGRTYVMFIPYGAYELE